ncbi:endonuclease III [Helicobacter enhydrae]|uniref:Endonuclease III n=1 Tax=Helicobacter enhydrae TaxID=222136 RepID=A0A1B1U4S4_9HELI|nr:endonuclease III [Helicobacter enhydrae]ANV97756.1 endonuclease III [Helicobacter enhydrae]
MSQKAQIIKKRFLLHYQHPKTELKYNNLYELLVCVMLSAQCTDKRVNLITPALFATYPTIAILAQADLEEVKSHIQSCSFFNNKAQNLIAMAQKVIQDFDGKIPHTQEELKTLPGVGQKTANVVLIEYFEQNFMAVDTHVFRVSHRLGLSKSKTAAKTEEDLVKLFRDNLSPLHQAFVLFGRYICKALKPDCQHCFVQDLCVTKQNFKP